VEQVASRYILKRYTRSGNMEIPFDRHNMMFLGPDGDTKARRIRGQAWEWARDGLGGLFLF